jgi:predicted transcriptional regulator
MMTKHRPRLPSLSRREREIMDVIYRLDHATAAEVRDEMSDPPSYSAVRAHLRILEDKGHLRHEADGPRYVFHPTAARSTAARRALEHVLDTFFGGSMEEAVSTLIDSKSQHLEPDELERLATLVAQARADEEEEGGG